MRSVSPIIDRIPDGLRHRLGSIRRAVEHRVASRPRRIAGWAEPGTDPWTVQRTDGLHRCNICRWSGDAFGGPIHCEGAHCPRCGSIGRDRFLFWALQHAVTPAGADRRLRVLETSPRLDQRYRQAMAGWFDYLCSDFDERAHAGMIRIDLQDIDLPTDSVDVILTPHVLEHVPDTGRALDELFRVLRPGGTLLLQVPVLQELTAPPAVPEFHGDHTPVFWRFGPALSDELAGRGFAVTLLAPQPLLAAAASDTADVTWIEPVSPEFDVPGILRGLRRDRLRATSHDDNPVALRPELESTVDAETARCLGFEPAYMFLTWVAHKPQTG